MTTYTLITHPFKPIYDSSSKILILGTLPSVKSRENEFYYGHPKNRFWKVVAAVVGETEPKSVAEKTEMLLRHNIALWDVIDSCDIAGSSDSSIRNVVPTDLCGIIKESGIERIFANGRKAAELYDKYQRAATGMDITCLPSTSPANAAWSFQRLLAEWKKIKP